MNVFYDQGLMILLSMFGYQSGRGSCFICPLKDSKTANSVLGSYKIDTAKLRLWPDFATSPKKYL